MKGGYILLNGKFHPEREPIMLGSELVNLNNVIKESFRAENNEILLAQENYLYLMDHLSNMELPVPKDWDLPRYRKDVSRLLNKNHLYLAARITAYFYKGAEYTNYLLTAEEIEKGFYPLNETGLLIDFYDKSIKNESPLNSFESSSRFLWILASLTMKANSNHNLLISNSKGFICEGIGVSFGFFQNKTLIFPSRDSGGYYPPLVGKIASQARETGIEVKTRADISREELLEADEVFLIDNTLGIQKVLGLNSRRYYSSKTTRLAASLKESMMQTLVKINSV